MGPMLAYSKQFIPNKSEIPTSYTKKPCVCAQAIHCVIDRQTVLCQHLHDEEVKTELKCTREGGYNYLERIISEPDFTELSYHRGFLDD